MARYCCSSPAVVGAGTLDIAFVLAGSTATPRADMRQPKNVTSRVHNSHFFGLIKIPKSCMRCKKLWMRSNNSSSVGACIIVSSKYWRTPCSVRFSRGASRKVAGILFRLSCCAGRCTTGSIRPSKMRLICIWKYPPELS